MPVVLIVNELSTRVKSGIFGQTAKFGQRPCLFHISHIGIKNKLTKQTVKILMRRLIRSRLIWIYTVCFALFVCLFDLILYVPATIFQLNRDGSSWVEPVLN